VAQPDRAGTRAQRGLLEDEAVRLMAAEPRLIRVR
jgi:hypothetical protein